MFSLVFMHSRRGVRTQALRATACFRLIYAPSARKLVWNYFGMLEGTEQIPLRATRISKGDERGG